MQKDIFYKEGSAPMFYYRFGNTVYMEMFGAGKLVSAGWNTAGSIPDGVPAITKGMSYDNFTELQSFDIEVDGRSIYYAWEFAGFEQTEEKEKYSKNPLLHGIVKLKNTLVDMSLEVHTILDGTSVMTRYISFTNNSDKNMNISSIVPMCGAMELIEGWADYLKEKPPENLYSVGYFQDNTWGHEGLFKWNKLPDVGYSIFGRYRRDRYRHPMFMLKNNALGNMFFAQMGWAGGYEIFFDLFTSKEKSLLSFKFALDSQKPMLVLKPGETFKSPEVHILNIQGDLDDAVNSMHEHLRTSVFTITPAGGKKGWLEAGSFGWEMETLKFNVDSAYEMGADVFYIDAAWFCEKGREIDTWWVRCGDWQADPGKFDPDLKEIREYVKSKGMLFGLWMDPERMGPQTELSKNHPDWKCKRFVSDAGSTMIDMSDPEALAWVESEICRVIEQYKIDMFRQDFNICGGEINNKINQSGIDECGTLRYYDAAIKMYERIREKYPDVIFENCAGGGGRTDIGFMRNYDHTWVSDWAFVPRNYAILNGMTMVLPPECVDRQASAGAPDKYGSLSFQIRTTLFGRPSTSVHNIPGSKFNPDQMEFIKHSYNLYQNFIRKYMADDGKIYHHIPECYGEQPRGLGVIERTSKDGKKGVIGVFHLVDCNNEYDIIYPKGLDMSKKYEVTFDNNGAKIELSGFDMFNNGIRVRVPGSLNSELIIYNAID